MLPLLLLAVEAATPQPPKIDPILAAEFWRAQAQFIAIKAEFDAKDAAVKAALAKLSKACGDTHQVVDNNGLQCVPKETPKK